MGKGTKELRERCGSMGSVEEMLKRKREDIKKDSREEGEDIFKKSNKTYRSPKKKGEKIEAAVELMAVWRREMEEIIKEMKEDEEGDQGVERRTEKGNGRNEEGI